MSLQPEYRFGIGYDVHRLMEGRPLILGGINIPHARGLEGHSDADALLHALTDAILGAIAEGDIGQHFSNTDPRWKDCDSGVFVREAVRIAAQRGYHVNNIDAIIMAEQPKMAPLISDMRRKISELVGIDMSLIGVKAGTMEKMGFVGREEGIACQAIVSLVRVKI